MTYNVPGKLQRQGPIATLDGLVEFGYYDKFLFNGEQFVQFVAPLPSVIEASANYALGLYDEVNVSSKITYADYKDASGEYRLVNDNPIHSGLFSGYPSGDYDHIVIGYDGPVTTSSVKFWAEEYIPVEIVRVDYSYDGIHWYNVTTNEGNVSFEFDSSMKLYDTETSPTGQYIYTVDLGESFTATYWRVRSFIGLYSTSEVEDVQDKDVVVTTTSGLPASSSTYTKGKLRLAYGYTTTWQQPAGALGYTSFESSGVDCVTWGTVTTVAGVTTVEDVVLDELSMTGDVILPGWVSSLNVSVYEDYSSLVGFTKTLYEDLTYSESYPITPDPDYMPDNWASLSPWYRAGSSNTSNCYFYVGYVNGLKVYRRYGDCWYSKPSFEDVRYYYGTIQSDDSFYLPSFATPFDVVSQGGFTSYLSGDIGSHGGVIHTSASVTTVSGVAAPPVGDPVTTVSLGAEVTYVSKTASTLETVDVTSWGSTVDLPSGYLMIYKYPMKVTQVKIQERDVSLLKFWESDGSIAVTKELQDSRIYDMVYDSSDSVYYAAIYSSTVGEGSEADDDFSSSYFDYAKWAITGGGIVLDTTNSGVLLENTVYGTNVYGALTNNYEYSSSFSSSLPTVVYSFFGAGYYGLSVVDTFHNNTVAFVGITGDWDTPATSEVVGVTIGDYVNASDSTFFISNVNVSPSVLLDGSSKHEFTYVDSLWYYSRTPAGAPTCDVCTEAVGAGPLLTVDGISLTVNTSASSISEYSYVSFTTDKVSEVGITTSGVEFSVEYIQPTDVFALIYNDGSDHTLISGTVSTLDSYSFSSRISGKTDDYANVFSSEFLSTGAASRQASVLSIVAIDDNGDRVEVPGVSDASGVVIGSLEAMSEGFSFLDYRGKVSIASSQVSESGGGSLFIRVGKDIYKYNKTTLPLVSDAGGSAALYSFDILDDENIRNFNYDSFVSGGLHYLVYDESRDLVIMKTMSSATLDPASYEVEVEIPTHTSPICLDPVDTTTLFSVVDSDVYALNMDSTSVAFCNVVSEDPVLPANSGFQTTITAFVTNLYGSPLSNKLVSFAITQGGGAIAPASVCTTSSGTASTVYTVDEVVGTSIITATASNTTC